MIGSSLEIMVPLLLAALGGAVSFTGGILVIGLEGLMLMGAFTGYAAAHATGSLLLGAAAGSISGVLLAGIFYVFTVPLKANIYIAGLALNLGIMGLVPVLSGTLFDTMGVINLPVPAVPTAFDLTVFFYAALAVLGITSVLLHRTVYGLHLYAAGENPDTAEVRGIDVKQTRFLSLLYTGVLCGAGGAVLSLRLGSFVPGITAGRGWIALVAVFLGRKHPLGIAAACFFFALTESFSVRLQEWMNIQGAATLVWATPYAVTLITVVIYRAAVEKRRKL
ncbi:MAG: ABC transporter permease [Spirochaetia bacterium]